MFLLQVDFKDLPPCLRHAPEACLRGCGGLRHGSSQRPLEERLCEIFGGLVHVKHEDHDVVCGDFENAIIWLTLCFWCFMFSILFYSVAWDILDLL